ncbi:MAG: T9SS type A sorting domain-containing protein [Flavobacteriales bacterium]|nr:T9SS type A sorting domain-containing protein [Flavobacteriales bacterium]
MRPARPSHSGSPYCTGSGTANVTRTGSAGGTYTATPAGLSISSSTGAITLGTSSVGTYTVTYSIAASGGCSAFSTTATVAVNNAPSATIAYSGSPYCTGSGTANVTRTGSAGGTYTATPAGLSINSSTGAINLGTSSVGSYSVTYSIAASGGCSAFSTTATVALNNAPSATIAYSGSPYCTGSGTANVTRTGSAGGTYTATPAGLSISSSTGAITLGTSSVGTYTVTYSIAASGGCSAFSTTATVAVNNAPSATIAYSGSPYCTSGGTADVTRTGTGGGTYNGSPYGLSINTGTGAIDLGASQPGSYTMIYTIAASGGCSMFQTTTTLVISSAPSATINYAGSPYCTDGGFAAVTRTGSGGGTFSASPAGLSINVGTGSINLGTSAAGTYTVTYAFTAGGGCAAFNTTATVTLDQAPSATIGYEGTPYCNAGGTADVTRTGTAGGTYTSSAGGLSLNSATGAINLSASNVNTYTVFYTIPANGACAQFVATTSVTIANAPNATITYEGSPYCAGGGVESVTRVGTAGGTYAATPAGLTINANNGAITLSSSSVGTYTVTYSIAASGGCSAYSTMATVTVNNAPSATIAYGGSPYCNGGGTATVTRIGSNGGTYSAVPAGLSINVNNGAILLGTSSPGSYTVTYSIAAVGGCSAFSTTAQVVVGDAPDATIEYAGSPYCGGTSASVLRTGSAGGTYTATPVGLSINANTGAVNITTSTPGSYTVTYSIAASGGCAAFSTTATVELNEETTWYADTDGDGVGVMAGSVVACTQPAGFVPISGDGCPNDPNKIAPGVCGCGIPDTDTDNDGAADCIDGCPTDPDKTAPGVCGCGIPDTDTDQDGLADCIDNCPLLDGVIGDACDDGDSTTVMDVITADCVCIGTFTIGISETVEGSGITLWPNPTADRAFTISMPHASAGGTVELTVRDASGRKVYANTSNISSSKQIAVQLPEATASGLYVVEVNIGEASTRLPLMCQ